MEKIIYTSNYDMIKTRKCISISKDKGASASYSGEFMLSLAPKEEFFRVWKNNRGKISEKENNLYYIKEFYSKVLKLLDPEVLIESLPNKSILLCYEDNMIFCHRHLVAFWLELFLDIKTYEVKEENGNLKMQERPAYLKDELEKIIKENYNMHGFNCIRAAYLYERAKQLEEYINKIYNKKTLDEYACELYTIAARLRMSADEAEQKYLKEKQNKVRKYAK